MYQLAPNIELIFTEVPEYHDRVRAAASAGFTAVEMWGPHGKDVPTRPKDIPAMKAALEETGVTLVSQTAEPRTQFMLPGSNHDLFYQGIDLGVEAALALGCPRIIIGSGTGFGGRKRQEQLDELIEIYSRASRQIEGSGILLLVEAANGRVDHPGALLDRTAESAYIARGVDSPFFGIAYDMYHSTVEGENTAEALAIAGDLLKYVEIADSPGRGEPGSGAVDWPARLADLRASGYDGPIGLEYYPTQESLASLAYIHELVASF